MLSYTPIDFEEPQPPPRVPMPQEISQNEKPVRRFVLKTETDYVVMAFVLGTIILIISDMMSKK